MTLEDKQWSESCYVERDKLGFYMIVSSTRQAMNLLSRYWPVSEEKPISMRCGLSGR